MVNYHIEVCIDNIESLHQAIAGGATRIELCSSLALGGLTPSFGFMRQAAAHSPIPVYAMIRPRQGDFFYTEEEVEIMMWDIEAAQRAGLQGVVLGLLNPDGSIDYQRTQRLCQHATALGLGVTFHRAFDQCSEPKQALEDIIALGCERILTSGLAPSAPQGAALLASLVEQAAGRIAIMAGAGVNASNVKELVAKSHVTEVHLSGKGVRPSKMHFIAEQSKMGAANIDDFMIPLTDIEAIAKTVSVLK